MVADLEPERDREHAHAAHEDAEATGDDYPDPETTDPYGSSALADRDWRADALGLPACPDWCDGFDADSDDLCCFRCWLTTEGVPTGDDLDLEPAPTMTGGDECRTADLPASTRLADLEQDVRVLIADCDLPADEAAASVVMDSDFITVRDREAVIRELRRRVEGDE